MSVSNKPPVFKGIWPVMLTPFDAAGNIDLAGLQHLVEFYITHGADGLFVNCLSSEFQWLTPDEMLLLCNKTVEFSTDRVPVITGMPQINNIDKLSIFAKAGFDCGAKSIILSTSQIAQEDESDDTWKLRVETLMSKTEKVPLGTYECPIPYKRLLSRTLFQWIAESGRFNFHKDTSCDNQQIREKLSVSKRTPLKFFNANLKTLAQSIKDGCDGYSGVDTNFFPELCVWLYQNSLTASNISLSKAEKFLEHALTVYGPFYPRSAKIFLHLRGVNIGEYCRTKTTPYMNEDLQRIYALNKEFQQRFPELVL